MIPGISAKDWRCEVGGLPLWVQVDQQFDSPPLNQCPSRTRGERKRRREIEGDLRRFIWGKERLKGFLEIQPKKNSTN